MMRAEVCGQVRVWIQEKVEARLGKVEVAWVNSRDTFTYCQSWVCVGTWRFFNRLGN